MLKNLAALITGLTLIGCSAESSPAHWQQSQSSNLNKFVALLDCKSSPNTDGFQDCEIAFKTTSNVSIIPEQILVDGGMPLHGHGLPTQPKLVQLSDRQGTFRIDGLKYNMPGAWLLGFKITHGQEEDKVIFDFII